MQRPAQRSAQPSSYVMRIPPFTYIHVQDTNQNITRVIVGPKVFVKQEHEEILSGKEPINMICLPPRHYCIIENPVKRGEDGKVKFNKYGEAEVTHGDKEIRLHDKWSEPFALYYREKLIGEIKKLQIVEINEALLITATRDYNDKKLGDEWLFYGPATYIPRIEEQVVTTIKASIIRQNEALKIQAKRECIDSNGVKRQAGEDWLVRTPGAYLPQINEKIVETLKPIVLTDNKALQLRALKTFTDIYGIKRKAGEEWLITQKISDVHILDVYEELVDRPESFILNESQFCYILDPKDSNGVNQLGTKELRKGPLKFFLQPGEQLEGVINQMYLLGPSEALLLSALEVYEDKKPGDKWMIYGPGTFIPNEKMQVVELRKEIPLHENEGVYVRDIHSGKIRIVMGQTYMLQAHEELFQMEIPEVVEYLLDRSQSGRDKSKVVTYKVFQNSVVQIYDYIQQTSRVVCGPDLVILKPEEQFTVHSLSGWKPKRPGVVTTLHLLLGPDFSSDIVTVETADHARLKLTLSYNWHFDVDRSNQENLQKVFAVRDFVGNMCSTLAAKVRGAVAATDFREFHEQSARIIRRSIFGVDEEGHIKNEFRFQANQLVITNVDIQKVKPVDLNTSDALQQSVTLAIEITTKAQEAKAKHLQQQNEQEARGMLERQKIEDESKAEENKKQLLELQASNKGIQSQGKAIAEAKARGEAGEIEGKTSINIASLKSEALKKQSEANLEILQKKQELELNYRRQLDELEINKQKQLTAIESEKFKKMMEALGKNTLVALAEAGPQTQAEIMNSLGLQGYLIMDSENPLNLFTTAQGMLEGSKS